MNKEIAQKNFDVACQMYEQSKEIIQELSSYAKVVLPEFSFEIAMTQFDLLLQGILLRTAMEDGYFLDEERQFIEKITDYADIMAYFNKQGVSISWENFNHFTDEQRKDLSLRMVASLKTIVDNFITPFALIDAAFAKDYCEELTKNIGVICVALSYCDGDEKGSSCAQSEISVAVALVNKLIIEKWQEVEESAQNESHDENLTRGVANAPTLKKQDLNVQSNLLCNYRVDRKRYQECVIYIETNQGSGTGVIVTKDGYFITCAHVIEGCSKLYAKVVYNDVATVYAGKVVTKNTQLDLAVCKMVDYNGEYAELDFERKKAELGEEIALYGFPFGRRMNDDVMELNISYAKGYVSSYQTINGQARAFLDVSAKAGNSGSPVASFENGKIIGFLSGSILGGENNREEVNYMVPVSLLEQILE